MIKLIILDVDGVLTDGKITYNDKGEEIKSFHVRDGFGIKMAKNFGVEIGVISARYSKITEIRCKELGIEHVFLDASNKLDAYENLKAKLCLEDKNIAYIGDDLIDLPVLKTVGFSATVGDAPDIVKKHVDVITPQNGGNGAVRHFIELIMKRNGHWEDIVNTYI